MNVFRENPWIVATLLAFLFLEIYRRVRARRAQISALSIARGSIPRGFEYEPPVITQTRCLCGRGASCESVESIVAAGWRGPDLARASAIDSPVDRERLSRWLCPDCARSFLASHPSLSEGGAP